MIKELTKNFSEEMSRGNMEQPIFEGSDRGLEMELSQADELDRLEALEGEFYPDSGRDIWEGPQWKESSLDDLKKTSELLSSKNPIEYKTEDSGEKKGLTKEEKKEIKEATGWSDKIIDAIGSMNEAEIYIDAGLQEAEINGKKCLLRNDSDMEQTDEDGISNRERMERGRPPITKDGQEIELHHIGQKPDSPLAELTTQEHRGVGNDTVLHDKNKESEIDRYEFAKERKSHWKSRVKEGGA